MNPVAKCLKCGARLPENARLDYCPACLFAQAALYLGAVEPEAPELAEEVPPAESPESVGTSDKSARLHYFGDYELIEEIARGGMGVVYKARQMSLNRPVAVKMVLAGQLAGELEVKRFRAEAEAAANLDHPNIVAIYEVGEHEGQHYFSMRLVEGQSLAVRLSKGQGPLLPGQAARLMVKVARAVHFAHQHGLLHRDLKPGNILLDAQDEPYVTDFGLAKRVEVDSSLSLSGELLGSPSYMSPEQASGRNKQLTTAADIYSLGATLYFCLTGRPPFRGQTAIDTIRQVIEKDPVPPSKVAPMRPATEQAAEGPLSRKAEEPPGPGRRISVRGENQEPSALSRILKPRSDGRCRGLKSPVWSPIDRDLETICLKCLEKEPVRRYASADALADDLERWLRGEPIVARPITARERAVKWAKRKPAIAGTLSALALTFLLGLMGILWQWHKANLHAAAERMQRGRAETALTQVQLERTEELLKAFSQGASGLAWLARVLRENPTNAFAARRLVSALNQRNLHLPVAEFEGVSCTAWSPDGRRLALGRANGALAIWNSENRQLVSFPAAHIGQINQVQFSPDGHRLLTAGHDGLLQIRDSESAQSLLPPITHPGPIAWAEFSTEGERLVTALETGTVRIWDAWTGQASTSWLTNDAGSVKTRLSPDGRFLLVATWNASVRLWDATSGQPSAHFPGFYGQVRAASFNADGNWFMASDDRLVRVWETQTGRPLARPMSHPQTVLWAEFSADGRRVFTTCADARVRLWNGGTSQLLREWPSSRGSLEVTSPGFPGPRKLLEDRGWPPPGCRPIEPSPNGQFFVMAHDDSLVSVHSAYSGRRLGDILPHERAVRSVSCCPRGGLILTRSADGFARVWDARPGQALPIAFSIATPLTYARFSLDGRHLLTVERSGLVRLRDSYSGASIGSEWRVGDGVVWAECTLDSSRLAVATSDSVLRVWDTETGRAFTEPIPHDRSLQSACLSPDGTVLATVANEGTLRIWSARSGSHLIPSINHIGNVCSLAFSSDGQRLVTANRDGVARVWDPRSGQPASAPLRHGQNPLQAQFTCDARRVVTASRDGAVCFWDVRTGLQVAPRLQHASPVTVLRLHPNGKLAAVVTTDGALSVWELPTGRMLFNTGMQFFRIQDACFAPDGSRVATTANTGLVCLWDVQTGLLVAETLPLEQPALLLQFAPDGQRLLVGLPNRAEIWEVPHLSVPAPAWLGPLAEAVARHRFNSRGQLEPVPIQELLELKRHIQASPSTDSYTSLARWFFDDRSSRRQSPNVFFTIGDHVQSLIDENTEPSLRTAVSFSPTNRLAFSRLAELLRTGNSRSNELTAAEAALYARQAQDLAK